MSTIWQAQMDNNKLLFWHIITSVWQLNIIINLLHYWIVNEHFVQSIETKKENKMKTVLKQMSQFTRWFGTEV